MSLSDQIKQPGQIIGAGGGGGATSDAGDLTTGTLDAARLPGVLANVDTQAELLSAAAAAAASHTHSASDIASGTVATARLGSGTADSTTFLRGDQTWATPSATDSTKLPLAGGTMTGNLVLSGANLQITGTQTSAGASVANIWRDSSGNLNRNVATGAAHNWLISGSQIGYLNITSSNPHLRLHSAGSGALYCALTYYANSAYYDVDGAMASGHFFRNNSGATSILAITYSRQSSASAGQIHALGNMGSIGLEALTTKYAAISCGNLTTANNVAYVQYGTGVNAGEGPGVIRETVGMVTRTSNGTWTNVYPLAPGTHRGDFWIYDSLGDGHARLPVNGTSLGTIVDNASGVTYVDSGSEAAGNVAFRISGGYLQINVGTSVTANTKIGIKFQGGLH